jgi:hypothetical protein
MKINYSPKDWQLLSNYQDGQLSSREVLILEKRLENEPALKQALNELQQTGYLMQHARKVSIPRSFTLSPEMAAQLRPVRKPLFPFFSFASVIATIFLVVVILFEFLPGTLANTLSFKSASDEILVMEAVPMAAPLMAQEEMDSANQPQIFEWGNPQSDMKVGMGGGADMGLMAAEPAEIENGPGIPEMPMEEPDTTANENRSMMKQADPESITGTGPILGIRPAEETDAFNDSVMNILSESGEEPIPTLSNPFPWLRVSQIILAFIAIGSAVTAIILRKRSF